MTPRPRGRSAYVCLSVVLIVSGWCLGDPASRLNAAGSWVIKPPPGTAVDHTSPLANGLVAAWHFDQGATPVNLANPALSGAYMGAPLLSPTADGTGMTSLTDADYLDVSDPGHVIDLTAAPFSVAVDFYYGAQAPGMVILGRDSYLNNGFNIQTSHDGIGKKILSEVNHDGTTDYIHTANDVLVVGAINRALFVFDGAIGTVYVNGVVQPLAYGGAYTPPTTPPEDLFVGRDASLGGLSFPNPITRVAMEPGVDPGGAADYEHRSCNNMMVPWRRPRFPA